MTRVLYLSQWFPPEPNAVGLQVAKALQGRGYEVEVLTGFPNYPGGKLVEGYKLAPYRRETVEGVTVHRVFLVPSHDRSSLGRALNYLSFFLSTLCFLLLNGHRYDVIYVYHPPITPALAAAVSGYVTRRPFIVEIQDLWPDSVAVSGMGGTSTLARILDPICRFVYRRAALVLGQSEGMTRRLAERGVPPERLGTVFNWADETATRENGLFDTTTLGFERGFNFVYAGNLGSVQALDVLIEAAERARVQAPEVQLFLVGEGMDKARLQSLVAERGIENVHILPGVPGSHIGDILAKADALVTHLKPDPLFEITIPSKTQFYLAMGRPILMVMAGEAAHIVQDAGAGLAVSPGNIAEIAQAMAHLATLPATERDAMGRAGSALYQSTFSFKTAIDRFVINIERITQTT